MSRLMFTAILAALLHLSAQAQAEAAPIKIVAAENFYGDLAQQIGGNAVSVTSILSNPNQDPHEFEASPDTARALANAAIVIYNGVDYDPWMEKLLSASKGTNRTAIVAGDLTGHKSGDNPHLWYDLPTMPKVAEALAAELKRRDPADAATFDTRLKAFEASMTGIHNAVDKLRAAHKGMEVTATEPVFGYMADAIGFAMRNQHFQIAVMNDTDPSPQDVAAFQDDLKSARVKILFYNNQVTDDLTKHMLDLAHQSHVAVVGVSETEPPGKSYQQWMSGQLAEISKAVGH
ncbi:MAG TPA: zinc ABC transporter substrate-binding protein [Stellaceae bacterium]|nr:zinc ABC transporter substrate-binding protein [Stellaceae bacterium]